MNSFYEHLPPDPKLSVKKLKEEPPPKSGLDARLPQPPFMMTIVAPRKSGKTYTVVDLLRDKDKFCGYFDYIFLFSKSYFQDSKWVKNLRIRPNCIFSEWNPAKAQQILESAIKVSSKYGKKETPKILMLFDDMASEGVMSPHTQGVMEKIATTGRHFNISAIFITQAYMRLSHTVRTNTTNMCVFRIRNAQELAKISEENRESLSKDEFFYLYNDVTSKPYSFLHINNQQDDPTLRFSNCWNEQLKIPSMVQDIEMGEMKKRKYVEMEEEEKKKGKKQKLK